MPRSRTMRSPGKLPIPQPAERGERRARPGFLPPQESLAGVYAPAALSPEERIGQLEEAVEQQELRLHGMIQISEVLRRSQEPKSAMLDIVVRISDLLNADRSTVYQVDHARGMLVGLAVQGETQVEVGLPFGQGLAGLAAAHRRSINLKDAYTHDAFDPRFDKLTGYETRSVLCVPMLDSKDEVIGVVQVLNKQSGYFTLEDQHLLSALATQAAITLEALQLQLQLRRSNVQLKQLTEQVQSRLEEQRLLFQLDQEIAYADELPRIADQILCRCAQVIGGEAAGLFLTDEEGSGEVWERSALDGEGSERYLRVNVGDGILGKTASRGEALFLYGDRFEDEAIPRRLCERSAREVRDVLSVPLTHNDEVFGALAVINRQIPEGLSDEEQLRFLRLLGGLLAQSIQKIRERQSLRQRDRMETIGQMLSGVLHDLKGPMASISGYTQLLARSDDAQKREEMALRVRERIKEFNEMTREVMAFARGQQHIISRKVYLKPFMESVYDSLRLEYEEHGIPFERRIEEPSGIAYFDEGKLRRVVINIARNARQAMGDAGSFSWEISRTEGGALRFVLRDTGPGIPEVIRDRVFEAFTTSGKKEGTGLGLAIVKRFIDEHGGEIQLETETGVGTCFTITLPQGEAREEREAQ